MSRMWWDGDKSFPCYLHLHMWRVEAQTWFFRPAFTIYYTAKYWYFVDKLFQPSALSYLWKDTNRKKKNMTGLQPVSRPVEQVPPFWGVGSGCKVLRCRGWPLGLLEIHLVSILCLWLFRLLIVDKVLSCVQGVATASRCRSCHKMLVSWGLKQKFVLGSNLKFQSRLNDKTVWPFTHLHILLCHWAKTWAISIIFNSSFGGSSKRLDCLNSNKI